MKVVINGCYGGFGLSHEGILKYAEHKGITLYVEESGGLTRHNYYLVPPEEYAKTQRNEDYFSQYDIERTDPALIATVEELGSKADGAFSKLRVVEIPDDVNWEIDEYDGIEHIAESHRTWS